jgi:hypothetical protein
MLLFFPEATRHIRASQFWGLCPHLDVIGTMNFLVGGRPLAEEVDRSLHYSENLLFQTSTYGHSLLHCHLVM